MKLGVWTVSVSRIRSGVLGIAWGGDQVGEFGAKGGVGGMGEGRGDTDMSICCVPGCSLARSGLQAPKRSRICMKSSSLFVSARVASSFMVKEIGLSSRGVGSASLVAAAESPAQAIQWPKYTPAPRMHPGACLPMSIRALHWLSTTGIICDGGENEVVPVALCALYALALGSRFWL